MRKLVKLLVLSLLIVCSLAAQDFFLAGHDVFDPTDSTHVRYEASGSRGLTAGADLDGDGLFEIYAAHYGHGGGVIGFEVTEEGLLEQIWNSDTSVTGAAYSSGTRIVQTGDLDGDGIGEVIFFRGRYYNDEKAGLYIYESDGTDNGFKEPEFFSIVDLGARFNFNGNAYINQLRVEYFTIDDVDNDGVEELIFASNGNSWVHDRTDTTATDTTAYGHSEDFFGILSATGDLQGLGGDLTAEFATSARDLDMGTVSKDHPLFGRDNRLGGGSAVCVAVSDIDGNGKKEIFCHAWNSFNNFFIEVNGPDDYGFGDTTYVSGLTGGDHVCIMNPIAADINNDGKDEIYASNYYTGNVWQFVDTDGSPTNMLESECSIISDTTGATNIGATFGAAAGDFDGNGVDEVYFGGTVGEKGDIIRYDGQSWFGWNTDTTAGGFVAKMDVADLDADGNLEIVTAHQSVPEEDNAHNWLIRVSEFGDSTLARSTSIKEYNVITPEDYKLKQAYPNPFNPTTNIEYSLPMKKEISLIVYDILGHKVAELVNNKLQNAGSYKVLWDGKDLNGKYVSSGIYLYSLEFGNYSKTKRVTFIK